MRKDIKVNQKCQLGRAPLLWAIAGWAIAGWTESKLNGSSTIDSLRLLLEQTEIDIKTHDHYGSTPLYLAARYNFPAAVRLLLERDDTDVNPKEIRREENPLSAAARKGYLEIVQLLLDHHNVDIDSKDKFGAKTIDWAEINGHHEVVRLLAKRSKMSTITQQTEAVVRLTAAVARADLNCCRVDSDKGNDRGRISRIEWWRGEYTRIYGEILHQLLQRDNVEINSRDKDGRTLLFRAYQHNAWEAVRVLLERTDIDVNCRDTFGLTPLLKASQKGHLGVMSAIRS
jgi:ankyrin repeat protein